MADPTSRTPGRHFLQIPGPSNVPDEVLRAMAGPTVDHRSPGFAELTFRVLENLKKVFKTSQNVLLFPSSGTGAWEAALVNTLSAGDRVLAFETGHFATLWRNVADRMGLDVEWVEGDWRRGVDLQVLETALRADEAGTLKAVMVVHSETSTGALSDIAGVRRVLDETGHDALLLVDTISSLASVDYRHDEWGVDVTVCCSQKGLMLPPGLGMNAVSQKALRAHADAGLPKSYWDWGPVVKMNEKGFFPYTPPTNLLYGMDRALAMILDEGLDNVFARHRRHADATRKAVDAWELDLCCIDPLENTDSLTAVWMPDGHDADALRGTILDRFDMSLGTGLGKVKGRVFRIGHLGDMNDLMLAGTLAGVEMGLRIQGVPHREGGLAAAMDHLVESA